MNNAPQLSVLIIEYHCIDQIKGCLPTLKAHLGALNWECVVVSNSEYDTDGLEAMRQRLPGARIVANDRNRGYAGGVNRGLPECGAPFVFVLNPDCRLTDDKVPELIGFLRDNPAVAAVGPKVLDEQGAVQPSCRRFPHPWTFLLVRSALSILPGAGAERRRYLMEDFDHDNQRDVDWLSGGAVLVRKNAIDVVGPMDERFFLYMEDVDWSRRFWQVGFRVTYVPSCVVIHAGQHASIQGGLKSLASRHTRFHLVSMSKYFLKHGVFGLGKRT